MIWQKVNLKPTIFYFCQYHCHWGLKFMRYIFNELPKVQIIGSTLICQVFDFVFEFRKFKNFAIHKFDWFWRSNRKIFHAFQICEEWQPQILVPGPIQIEKEDVIKCKVSELHEAWRNGLRK
mgnify:CR=1 FL=1